MPLNGLDRISPWAICGSSPHQRSRHLAGQVLRGLGIEVRKERQRGEGLVWVLSHCPFCLKTDGATHVEVKHDGKLCFACKHNSCCRPDGRRHGWGDLRARYEAGRDPPGGPALNDSGQQPEGSGTGD